MEWVECLQDASEMQTGSVLYNLLVTILIDCVPADALALWSQFEDCICDDLKWHIQQGPFSGAD